jgi:phospholipase C
MPGPTRSPAGRLLPAADAPLPGIEHVVVLMLENRSFDNVLGRLYPKSEHFDGVPLEASNTYEELLGIIKRTVHPTNEPPSGHSPFITPFPDPGESFKDMTRQIFGAGSMADMSGFAQNYHDVGILPRHPGDIMVYFEPAQLRITSLLARRFAVSDRWFASGPVQTFPNRMFCHCATPGLKPDGEAHLEDSEYMRDVLALKSVTGSVTDKSVFELLDGRDGPDPVNWKVYFHDFPFSAINAYVNDAWAAGSPCVASFDAGDYAEPYGTSFASDVENDRLPAYAFIEPRYFDDYSGSGLPPNSNHPGVSAFLDLGVTPIDVRHGEKLLADTFLALAAHPAVFAKTLLIVTYDEHGGLYDHVPPGPAVSPFRDPQPGNFDYTRFGVRVPAFFINPRITPQTVYRPAQPAEPGLGFAPPFDHTSIIATLRAQFGLGGALTPRDAAAPVLSGLVSETIQSDEAVVRLAEDLAVTARIGQWLGDYDTPVGTPGARRTVAEHDRRLVERLLAKAAARSS